MESLRSSLQNVTRILVGCWGRGQVQPVQMVSTNNPADLEFPEASAVLRVGNFKQAAVGKNGGCGLAETTASHPSGAGDGFEASISSTDHSSRPRASDNGFCH